MHDTKKIIDMFLKYLSMASHLNSHNNQLGLIIGLMPLIIKNSLGFLMLWLFVIANNLSPIT